MIHDILFPPEISIGATGGPEYLTRILATAAGHEYRNVSWSSARGRWNVAQGVKTADEKDQIIAFYRNRRGKAYGFRFKDWFDFRADMSVFGVGNGADTIFPIYKQYDDGVETLDRRIVMPVNNTVYTDADPIEFFVDGSPAAVTSVNFRTGYVQFSSVPGNGTLLQWSGEFHVPARFDTDNLVATLTSNAIYDWNDIPIVELRWEEAIETWPEG